MLKPVACSSLGVDLLCRGYHDGMLIRLDYLGQMGHDAVLVLGHGTRQQRFVQRKPADGSRQYHAPLQSHNAPPETGFYFVTPPRFRTESNGSPSVEFTCRASSSTPSRTCRAAEANAFRRRTTLPSRALWPNRSPCRVGGLLFGTVSANMQTLNVCNETEKKNLRF